MISLVRCDDRLIHGQIMTRIVQHFFIKRIIAVDDFTASNPVLKSIFEKAVPPGMTAHVTSFDHSYELISKAQNDNVNTLILFRTPLMAERLFNRHEKLSDSLMIGPVASKPNSKSYNFGSYLNEEEAQAVENLVSNGIEVYFQVVPGEKRTEWTEAKAQAK